MYFNLFDGITAQEIKSQYRDLIKKYHPDVNPDGLEAMKQINKEFEELMHDGANQAKSEQEKIASLDREYLLCHAIEVTKLLRPNISSHMTLR